MSNLLRKNHLLLETTLFACQVHILNMSQNDELAQFSFASLNRYPSFFSLKTLFLEFKLLASMILNNRQFALRGHVT